MQNRTSFKLEGFDDLNRRLKEIGPELATKAGQSAIRDSAKLVQNAVIDAAPRREGDSTRTYKTKSGGTQTVDYGHLWENIKIRKAKALKPFNIVYTVTTGNAFWAKFLEFGTVKMAAIPFFKPAFEAHVPLALDAMKTQLGKALDRIAKRYGR